MKKRYTILAISLALSLAFSGCMGRRTLPPDQKTGQGNPGSMISATYSMADLYNVVLKNNAMVRGGTDGNSPNLYTLTNGTTVRVLGKVDNNWYVVLPSNNRVGLIPISSAAPAPATQQQPVPAVPNSPTNGSSSEEATMISLVNSARTSNGLKSLTSDDQLTKIARLKAQDLANNNYFSHTSPTYGSPFDMLKTYGVSYLYAGENLAKNSNVGAAETALMNSPGHRANILNGNYTNIGIGIATAKDGTKIYTQMFIGR